MPKVFISHASSDKRFTNLLAKILDFHQIDPWYDSSDILPGTQFPKEIEAALDDADSLIAVISQDALRSQWVKHEVSYFQAKHPNHLVPVVVDDTNERDFSQLMPGLEQYQAINFNQCMLAGFEKLMAHYDREFLPVIERRGDQSRRTERDRRTGQEDRRKSPIDQRLRVGFWKHYEQATGIGKFELVSMGLSDRAKMISALKAEVNKYTYHRNDSVQNPEQVLEEAVIHAPDRVWGLNMDSKAIYMIEAAVEHILENYQVTVIDRRQSDRREERDRRML